MKYLINIFILIFIGFFISACSGKKLTIKSLHPSKIENEKIHTIKVDRFYHDDVNQTISLENRIANKKTSKYSYKYCNNKKWITRECVTLFKLKILLAQRRGLIFLLLGESE